MKRATILYKRDSSLDLVNIPLGFIWFQSKMPLNVIFESISTVESFGTVEASKFREARSFVILELVVSNLYMRPS